MATIDVSLYTGFRNRDYYKSGGTYPVLSIETPGGSVDLSNYYSIPQIDSSFYTKNYINSNFDNYVGWDLYTTAYRTTIGPEGSLNFFGDGSNIQVQYNQTSNTIEIEWVGTTGSMDDWYFEVDGGANHAIANHGTVNFQAGTDIDLTYTIDGSVHGVIIDCTYTPDLSNYQTIAQADASFYTRTYINNNFDDYQGFDIYTTVYRNRIGPEGSLNFAAGGLTSLNYDEATHTITYSSTGGSGDMDDWYLLVDGAGPYAVQNHEKVDFISGDDITVSYYMNTGTSTNEITFSLDQTLSITSLAATSLDITTSIDLDQFSLYNSTDRSGLLEISGDGTGYHGIQLRCETDARWSWMGQQGNVGLYDDTNSEWILNYFENGRIDFYYNGAVKMATATGGVAITGALTATTEITSYSSDRRLKCNIRPITSPLHTLNQIDGIMYNWDKNAVELAGFKPIRDEEIGFIAQDLQKVLPEAVGFAPFDRDEEGNSKSGEDYLTVKPEKLIPLMVEAIKELKAEIEELKTKINKRL